MTFEVSKKICYIESLTHIVKYNFDKVRFFANNLLFFTYSRHKISLQLDLSTIQSVTFQKTFKIAPLWFNNRLFWVHAHHKIFEIFEFVVTRLQPIQNFQN